MTGLSQWHPSCWVWELGPQISTLSCSLGSQHLWRVSLSCNFTHSAVARREHHTVLTHISAGHALTHVGDAFFVCAEHGSDKPDIFGAGSTAQNTPQSSSLGHAVEILSVFQLLFAGVLSPTAGELTRVYDYMVQLRQ